MSRRAIFLASLLLACQPRGGGGSVAGPETAAGGLAPGTVVARIDGKDVTAGEVDKRIHSAMVRAQIEHDEKIHDLRAQALEDLINERLVEKQAKSENTTADALVKREVDSTIAEPSEEEERALYKQASDAGQQLPPFEQIRDQIAKFIKDQQQKEKLQAFHTKLREKATVLTMLPAPVLPRVDVDTSGPSRGAANAPVVIVEFSDYECPFCRRAEPTVKEVMDAYKDKVRIVYREFPLPNHQHAQPAAEAALCALDQNKYWEMHDKMFASDGLEVTDLKGYAKELGLDTGKFDKCLDGHEKKDAVAASVKAGEEAGVSGTPAFFINGKPLSGAVPIEKFKEIIDPELASAK